MKQFFLLLTITCLSLAGCKKKDSTCTGVEPSAEEAAIIAFNTANGYTATKHSTGLYYQIVVPGTGATPRATSNVRVQYTGKLFNGTVFDSNTSPGGVSFNLSNVIQGWQIGVPLIQSGGTIRLMIPSKYAYSCTGKTNIPPNTPLFFDIHLQAVF